MPTNDFTISGNITDVLNEKIFSGTIVISNGKIKSITKDEQKYDHYILPGFIDSHIHIESSMLTPFEFARMALRHGTLATVSDPHEIANVCGMEGVFYMLENAKNAKLKFHFGAPSCVPATNFETAGASLDPEKVEELLKRNDIFYLSEMMNYPGVLFKDADVMKKISAAVKYKKPVDGHAPGLRGDDAKKYIGAGISTDHECFTKEEALDKIKYGMKILIREGSAAKNFGALHSLISEYPDLVMFCSDDKHPDDLIKGHINEMVKRALAKGHSLMNVLKAACVNPVLHYHLPVGLLQVNDPADFIVVNNLQEFKIQLAYIEGEKVATSDECILNPKAHEIINVFSAEEKIPDDFKVMASGKYILVIKALDGQLITEKFKAEANIKHGELHPDIKNDILKITVVNRYQNQKPAVAFINNFGLKKGAIASTVAHDSHNIIAVGTNDEEICKAVNLLIKNKGGLCVIENEAEWVLALPVAGLMSVDSCEETGKNYSILSERAKALGCRLNAPFMTLSFMALLVIPDLKLSDKGLFEGSKFQFVNLAGG
jgi:adenine deaminase